MSNNNIAVVAWDDTANAIAQCEIEYWRERAEFAEESLRYFQSPNGWEYLFITLMRLVIDE